ncbi:MAG: hypothetical protein AB8C02_05185 [Halioglobus sp.]
MALTSASSNTLVPSKIHHGPVTKATAPDLLFYESSHSLNIGDKGKEAFNLSVVKPACGQEALVFHSARLVYKRKRFGEARIVRSPPSGCFNCPPLEIDWYHEPTGYVDFQVHIYRKRVSGQCSAGQSG